MKSDLLEIHHTRGMIINFAKEKLAKEIMIWGYSKKKEGICICGQ